MSSPQIQTIDARKIPISAVTVFTDRAEVIRNFKVSLKEGTNEIQLENVPNTIVQNSISVDGRGKDATIHEVRYETKPSNPSNNDREKVQTLKDELKEVEKKLQSVKELNGVLNSKFSALNNLLNKYTEKSEKSDSVVFNAETETGMEKLFDFYEKKVMELHDRIKGSKDEETFLTNEVGRLQQSINQLSSYNHMRHIISIEIEAEKEIQDAELTVTYQCHRASWTPSYDLKAKSSKDSQSEIKLTYFGNIQQTTGEDWDNVELSLSTAQPSLGNSLPKMGSTVVGFYRPPAQLAQQPQVFRMQKRSGGGLFGAAMPMQQCTNFSSSSTIAAEELPQMVQAMAITEDSFLSTSFNITQKKSIPSDSSKKHKVTITVATLTANLHYECVPKKDTKVYLMASVTNDSDCPLISGPANVYIDNSLSTNIHLKGISPGEKFNCSLGVDKSIKVIYKPTHKFQSSTGVFTTIASSGTEQRIVVKNTKRTEPIKITLYESIPKSSEEKIRLKVLAPENIKQKDPRDENPIGAYLDDLHNLQWTEVIQPEKEKEFVIKWALEYPPNEKITFNENFQQEGLF